MAYVECQLPKVQRRVQTGQTFGESDKNDVDYLKTGLKYLPCTSIDGVAFFQEDAWVVLRFHPKWDDRNDVDLTGDVPGLARRIYSGHDCRPRPARKQRLRQEKANPTLTASTGGELGRPNSGSNGAGACLESGSAERAFEASERPHTNAVVGVEVLAH
ncbi:hypothetical protein Tco_0762043 [Tanacetum coccineum]